MVIQRFSEVSLSGVYFLDYINMNDFMCTKCQDSQDGRHRGPAMQGAEMRQCHSK